MACSVEKAVDHLLILESGNSFTLAKMVGAVRFELTTSCTRNKRASRATLRPEPKMITSEAVILPKRTIRASQLIRNLTGLFPGGKHVLGPIPRLIK